VKARFDLDEGMVLIIGDQYYHGDKCIHVLSLLSESKGVFGALNAAIFASPALSRVLYPVLRAGRNLVLRMLGKSKIRDTSAESSSYVPRS
jgi:hypothetical protein